MWNVWNNVEIFPNTFDNDIKVGMIVIKISEINRFRSQQCHIYISLNKPFREYFRNWKLWHPCLTIIKHDHHTNAKSLKFNSLAINQRLDLYDV